MSAVAIKRPRGRPRKTADELDDGNRRLHLLATAGKLFRRKGFDATTTRDIATAAGMQSGSPFYHFKTKGALLHAVMHEGMKSALLRQADALRKAGPPQDARALLAVLVRNHFDVLLGAGSDFIPVMLYEWRSITARQRAQLADLQGQYEAPWLPVLRALHDSGQLKAEVKLARLLIFGALNWSVQWFDRRKGASPQALADAALALFIHDEGGLK